MPPDRPEVNYRPGAEMNQENSGRLSPDEVERARLPTGKKIHKLNDGAGLVLMVDARSKAWRFRYRKFELRTRIVNKGEPDERVERYHPDALLSLGVYPEVSLTAARARAKAIRDMLADGRDPQAARQKERDQRWLETSKTFGVVAAEYNAKQDHRAAKTVERCKRMYRHSAKLHNHIFPELDRPMLLQACRVLERVGKHETAHRLGVYFGQVFRYARDEGYFSGVDPTIGGFGKSLRPVQETHQPALTHQKAVGSLVANIDAWEWLDTGRGSVGATVGRALQVLARTAVRPGELRSAEWREIDLDRSTWVIPVSRMKMRDGNRTDHVVPLSRQVREILRAQQALTGHGKYVFPNARTDARPMTDAALSVALVALGYKDQHVPHGFRTTFKTLSLDVLKAELELIERQLAHKWGTEVQGAYDRAQRLDERRQLMQAYSDLLDKLRDC